MIVNILDEPRMNWIKFLIKPALSCPWKFNGNLAISHFYAYKSVIIFVPCFKLSTKMFFKLLNLYIFSCFLLPFVGLIPSPFIFHVTHRTCPQYLGSPVDLIGPAPWASLSLSPVSRGCLPRLRPRRGGPHHRLLPLHPEWSTLQLKAVRWGNSLTCARFMCVALYVCVSWQRLDWNCELWNWIHILCFKAVTRTRKHKWN